MNPKKAFVLALGLGLLGTAARAQDCATIQSTQDILACALERHPDIAVAREERRRDANNIVVAGQRPNPEFEGRLFAGRDSGQAALHSEANLLHTLELGGKREARIDQAKARLGENDATILQNQETVALQTVLALHRLRQIESELANLDETVASFEKTLSNFKTRPQLSQEQEVTFASFSLAAEDYRARRIALAQQGAGLRYFLELATGLPYARLQPFLPKPLSRWPDVAEVSDDASLKNSNVAQAKSAQSLALANRGVASSNAWPNLQLGPTFESESRSAESAFAGGLAFSVPLPLLNRARGEKAYAQADQIYADRKLQWTLEKTANERRVQWQRYRSSRQAFQNLPTLATLHTRHRRIEASFEQGLVPSALFIEAHRQLDDILKIRHEQELSAIDALWRLRIIDGEFQEARL